MNQSNITADTVNERQAKLLRLAEEQGVKPIENTDELRGDFWDEADEHEETFDQWLRRTRSDSKSPRPEGDRRRAR